MGKVWFIVGLVASRYYIAINATNIIGFSLLFAALFSLTGGYMEPDPTPLPVWFIVIHCLARSRQ